MAQPVVHFEVVGKDPARLRDYFSQLFGWSFAVPSPVAQEVSAPDEYGFLDLITADDGTGMRATPSSTSVCQMSRPPCSVPRTSAVLGSWVPSRHQMDSLSVISRTLKAP
jgi:hypothetical protein